MNKITTFALSLMLMAGSTGAYAASDAFDTFGTVGAIGVPLAAGLITLSKDDNEGVFQLGTSYLLTMGVTQGLKYTVDETRPNGGSHSFPSGHASSAFAGASYLMFRYGWEYGVPAYVAASAVAWSRVDSRHHHWKDVIASAAIANLSAYFLTDKFERKVAILPVIDPSQNSYGLVAAMRF